MSRRSNGRPSPSRGARVELRKLERAVRGKAQLVVPPAIRDLTVPAANRRSMSCNSDPTDRRAS